MLSSTGAFTLQADLTIGNARFYHTSGFIGLQSGATLSVTKAMLWCQAAFQGAGGTVFVSGYLQGLENPGTDSDNAPCIRKWVDKARLRTSGVAEITDSVVLMNGGKW